MIAVRTPAAPVAAATTRGPVPRWADWAAQATLWCVLPSGIWRILFGLGLPAGFTGSLDPQNDWFVLPYVIALTAVSEAVAFLSLGLVRPWGEIWPRWVPFLRGRTIRPMTAIVPAALGSVALMALWTPLILSFQPSDDPEMPHGAKAVILAACYLPLVAWGPLLAAVTAAYAVRRHRHG
ncbi:hypothetical protein [Actinomadura rubrisoli]|uniref:Uncharacterized protein n=1 Tax=Actinomadura rubrisoli TaxID=2530368 RepID=A0A4R5BLI1_9ACTN|nr:hypothetical protein [Actinomadura rubrisoli]TDD85930.1 hypothetical protein E1298_18075 [Actinomadura rubrisoli]